MKRLMLISILLMSSFTLFVNTSFAADMPGPDAKQLWNYITQVSPYQKWGHWQDHSGMQSGRAPHGPKHIVYVNDLGLSSTQPPLKYGSIQVKESFNNAGVKKAITVMYKLKGFNPRDGDWYWAKYSLKGKARPAGKARGCIECHGTRERNDFVMVHEF